MHFPLIWMQILICGFLDSCFVLSIMFCALCMLYPQRLSPLCRETLNDIMTRGHSRVPVYAEKPTNIIGLVLVIHFFLLLRYFFWIIDISDSTHTHTHTHTHVCVCVCIYIYYQFVTCSDDLISQLMVKTIHRSFFLLFIFLF